ncbi:hypothetical protein D3C80_1991090 [compost metagenome]
MIGAEGICGHEDLPGAEGLRSHHRVNLFSLDFGQTFPERDGWQDCYGFNLGR